VAFFSIHADTVQMEEGIQDEMADALRTQYKPPTFHRQIITSVKPCQPQVPRQLFGFNTSTTTTNRYNYQ
jgi:hypothetical protein